MINPWTTGGAVAAAALMLLAPGLAHTQALAAFNIDAGPAIMNSSTGSSSLGAMAAGSFDPAFGPKAQDAVPHESSLSVRVYDSKAEYTRGFVHLELGRYREAVGNFEDALSAV